MKRNFNAVMSFILAAIIIASSALCGMAVNTSTEAVRETAFSEKYTSFLTTAKEEELTKHTFGTAPVVTTTKSNFIVEFIKTTAPEETTTESTTEITTEASTVVTTETTTQASTEVVTETTEVTTELTEETTEESTAAVEEITTEEVTEIITEIPTATTEAEITTAYAENALTNASEEKASDETTTQSPSFTKPEKVVVSSITSTKNGVTLKWNDALTFLAKDYPKAKGYYVYKKTSKTEWDRIATVKDAVKYTDKNVKYGETYIYTVKAFYVADDDSTVASAYEKKGYTVKVEHVTKPVLKKAELYKSEDIKITWSKTYGATKYALYRSTSADGKYEKIYTGTATSFIDKIAKPGSTYYYKLKAYTDKKASVASSAVSYKYTATTPQLNKKLSVTGDTVNLKWTRAIGAEGYVIYRRSSTKDKWTSIKTIKSGDTVTYADKKLTSGKIYYYLIKSYYADKDGNHYIGSSSVTAKTLAAPKTISTSTNSNNHLNSVTWSKVDGASGYEVYIKVGTASWKLLTTTEDSTRSYYHSVTENATYYYKVRAIYGTKNISCSPCSKNSKVIVDSFPAISYVLPESGIDDSTNFKLKITNNGKSAVRVQAKDAVLLRASEDGSKYLEVDLKMRTSLISKYVDFVDVKAGETELIYLYPDVSSFGYKPDDLISFKFTYGKGVYVAVLSYAHEPQIYYYGQS